MSGMNRRHFLKHVAAASALALPGMEFVRTIQANAQTLRRNNKSVVILWMQGGPATIDIWDLKPGRPTGGEFTEIQTSAPGVRISQHMPRVAEQMRNLAIIRSLSTSEGDHNRGTQLMHTSYTPNPAIAFPSLGSIMAHEAPKLAGYQGPSLPAYLTIGGGGMGATGGFLGMNFAPFNVQNPGTTPENIRAPGNLGSGTDLEDRVQRRRRLFNEIEDQFMFGRVPHLSAGMAYSSQSERDARLAVRARFADASKAHRDVYYKGFSLTASKEGQVFDLKNEKTKLMEDYGAAGQGASNFGRAAILARRLLESGVSAVELSLGGWDTHGQNFNALATRQLPPLDRAMGTLVRDLVDRGMWQNTVVVWMGEFGRTPRINQNNGRDHWSRCWSVVVGGGAIRGGQAYGATDADGMDVARDRVNIGNVFASIYRGLGIDPDNQVRDPIGRPFRIAGMNGRPIDALFGA
ncbi:MAG TPA: DUF1501 domain-containing protein [Gemmataceae bacterium]|nr:DUF1501 domain-containing protein [Gemmataceae bacterium]